MATACVVVVVLTASCSSSGTKTDGADAAVTTTVALRPVSTEDLQSLLPGADEIGPTYDVVADAVGSDDGPQNDAWNEAFQHACEDLYRLTADAGEVITVALARAPMTVDRSFADEYLREVTVMLTTDDDLFPMRDQINALVVAINHCDIIEVPGSGGGPDTSVRLQASPDSNYGDVGMVMKMELALSGGDLPVKIRRTGHVRAFQYGAVTAVVTTVDGFEPGTARAVRVDKDLARDLAKRLNRGIRDLQDG